jgi:uncharacterized protein
MKHRLERTKRPGLALVALVASLCAVLALLTGLARRAEAQPSVPVIDRPVVDVAHVLGEGEAATIAQRIVDHRNASGVQLAVLTVKTTGGMPIEDYAHAVASAWGGGQAGRDDGVLFVLAVDDRRSRIEVGYGLEEKLTDARARAILDAASSDLKRGAYGAAVSGVVERIAAATAGGARAGAAPPRTSASAGGPLGSHVRIAYPLVFVASAAAGFAWRVARRRRSRAELERIMETKPEDMPADARPLPRVLEWAWLVIVVAAGAILWAGDYGLPYVVVAVGATAVGAAMAYGIEQQWRVPVVLFGICLVVTAITTALFFEPDSPKALTSPAELAGALFVHVISAAAVAGFMAFWWLGSKQTGGSSGSSSWSSSSRPSSLWSPGSSSSTSSSWSSSSSSASSWSSHSSSSSSSWSSGSSSSSGGGASSSWGGGGGSFGGGGASSSW